MARKRTISDAGLLEAAREVFVERGFAASTREIARRAGVSEGLLFQRYGTKAELFFAAMVPPRIDLRSHIKPPVDDDDGLVTLTRLGFDMLEYFRSAMPVLMPLLSHPDFKFEEFAARHPDSSLVAMRAEMTAFFTLNRAADAGGAALVLMASLQGIAMFERLGAHGGAFPPVLIERTISTIWKGVAP